MCKAAEASLTARPPGAGQLFLQVIPRFDHCFHCQAPQAAAVSSAPSPCPVLPAMVCSPHSHQRAPVSTESGPSSPQSPPRLPPHSEQKPESSPRPTKPCTLCPILSRLSLPHAPPHSMGFSYLTHVRHLPPRAPSRPLHRLFPLPGMLFPNTRLAPPSPY